jgi:23S rRNA (uracil1939-C5)-methyltransferase
MKIKKGLQAEVEIADLAYGGQGLARLGGMALFVDQAVPGDRVTIRIFRKKKKIC